MKGTSSVSRFMVGLGYMVKIAQGSLGVLEGHSGVLQGKREGNRDVLKLLLGVPEWHF